MCSWHCFGVNCEVSSYERRHFRGQKQPEKVLLITVKTLRIYSEGNWEPLKDFGAEEWQNEIFIFQLNIAELGVIREASHEAVK
jgi:hypothetical protein